MTLPVRVAVNGFGRIGRQVVRQVMRHHPGVEIVAVNSGRGEPGAVARLFAYDSMFGRYPGRVDADDGHLVIDGLRLPLLAERDPHRLPWSDLGVDVVVEATGAFRTRETASAHLGAGARKVCITAPARDADLTLVVGVNDDRYDPVLHDVVSAASCTTNCLAPMVLLLDEAFGLRNGILTTIHAFTRDQELQDGIHNDPRRGRSAAVNVVPTGPGPRRPSATCCPPWRVA